MQNSKRCLCCFSLGLHRAAQSSSCLCIPDFPARGLDGGFDAAALAKRGTKKSCHGLVDTHCQGGGPRTSGKLSSGTKTFPLASASSAAEASSTITPLLRDLFI